MDNATANSVVRMVAGGFYSGIGLGLKVHPTLFLYHPLRRLIIAQQFAKRLKEIREVKKHE